MKQIACPQCGINNRITRSPKRQIPVCGRCGTPLPQPGPGITLRTLARYKYWLILAAILGGGLLSSIQNAQRHRAAHMDRYTSPRTADLSSWENGLVPQRVEPGVLQRFGDDEDVAPLRIVTPAGRESYYVKVVDEITGETVQTIFMRSGQTLETRVPLGTFRIRYAGGVIWYGPDQLFGPGTSYNQAEKTFEFAVDGDQIRGYTVALGRQRGGNLKTTPLAADEF